MFYHPIRRIKEILLIIRCQLDRRSLKVALLQFPLQLHAESWDSIEGTVNQLWQDC